MRYLIRKNVAMHCFAAALLAALLSTPVSAALTDIAAEPVIIRQTVSAKPNLMFVLDDSGSMSRDFMPDEMSSVSTYGYLSAQCNGVAFDPALPYSPPVDAEGVPFLDMGLSPSFPKAKDNGYTGSAETDLSGRFYYSYTGSQKKMGWTYDAAGNEDTSTVFYKECNSSVGSTPGNSKFTKVLLSTQSLDERKRYANWYSYYRTRSLLMRTAVGRAVQKLKDSYRVGFSRINSTAVVDGTNFRDAKVFDSTQRAKFYASLYGAEPGGGTPLRGALSKIGRYYANKARDSGGTLQPYDPVEYSCQRNYALLSTDGYWNSGGSPGVSEGSTYGPFDLSGVNGVAVGNQDSREVRPMYDGGNSTTTDKTPITTVTRREVVTTSTVVTTNKRDSVEVDSVGCKVDKFNEYVTPETNVVTTSSKTTSILKDTATKTHTVVTTNGTVTSDSTSAASTVTTTESAGSPVGQAPSQTGWTKGTKKKTQNCKNSNQVGPAGYINQTSSSSQPTNQSSSKDLDVVGPTVGTTTSNTTTSGGSSDTLADVAEYYYVTDLRSPAFNNCTSATSGQSRDVCENKVPSAGRDNLSTQHMTTFTLGLGTSGTLVFDKDYLTQKTGDFASLVAGTKNWPPTTTALSGGSGDARNIDDLWHAAVNGRGQYYSALDATGLSNAIASVISTIKDAEGAGASASFNSLAFVAGSDNQVFQGSYVTNAWTGDVTSLPVDGASGAVIDDRTKANYWSARDLLDVQDWTTRKIYYKAPASATLRDFTFANLSSAADNLGALFSGFCNKTPTPGQCNGISDLVAANTGTNLVNYLRGDQNKNLNSATPLYRTRAHVLGDIINGAPVFVGKPPFAYTDAGYTNFVSSKTNPARPPMIYVGANDGMLHAFSASTGIEKWAYVPGAVMPKMFRLADSEYPTSHESYVDAEPAIGDIYDKAAGAWKTILVGGLGLGGKAYYALDITDPDNPEGALGI